MIIDDENSLKSWIIKDVASLTDADADRLAMYVIALLKKPLSDEDLVELCTEKLDVFLQSHTKDFVERIFDCLKTGAYLPESANMGDAIEELVLTDPSDAEDPCDELADSDTLDARPSANSDREERKSMEHDLGLESKARSAVSSERITGGNGLSTRVIRRRISPPPSDSRRTAAPQRFSPSRNRRVLPPSSSSSRRSPPPRGRSERYHRRRSYSRSRSRSRSPHREKRRDDHEGSARRRCRDFHEKGFCMRGDKCNYDHGPDPVVIENAALEKIVSRTTTTAPAVVQPSVTSSTLYSPGNPPPPGVNDSFSAETAGMVASADGGVGKLIDFSVPPPPLPSHMAPPAIVSGIVPSVYPASSSALVTVVPNMQNVVAPVYNGHSAVVASTTIAGQPQAIPTNAFMPYGGGPYAPRGAGGFGRRGRGRFKPYGAPLVNPALCSLLVKKIPPEQNKIVLLDQHFGKFGQITNLHVQFEGQPDTALVTFKTRREALNAYKSTEPIFNNRFIKVFWQTQPEGTENGVAGIGADPAQPQQPALLQDGNVAIVPMDSSLGIVKTENVSTPDAVPAIPVKTEISDVAVPPQQPSSSPNRGPKKGIYNARAAAAAKKKAAEQENLQKLREIHRLKMELYQKQIEQQRELLQRVQSTDDKELKKKILELVKKRDESIKSAKADLESLSAKIAAH